MKSLKSLKLTSIALFLVSLTANADISVPGLNCAVFTSKNGSDVGSYSAEFIFTQQARIAGPAARYDATPVSIGANTLYASAFRQNGSASRSTYALFVSPNGGAAELSVAGIRMDDVDSVADNSIQITGVVGVYNLTVSCQQKH